MSETSKTRHRVQEYIHGNGIDIGCANDKIKFNCIGIDLVRHDTEIPEVNLRGNAENLHWFADGVFDFVYSSHTLEDMYYTKPILEEWLRVLKIGGYLILYLPHKHFYPNIGHPHANLAHKYDFLPEDIIHILKQIGQTVVVINNTFGCEKYIYEERGKLEYSFLIVARKI